jgi:hypothetical protein
MLYSISCRNAWIATEQFCRVFEERHVEKTTAEFAQGGFEKKMT